MHGGALGCTERSAAQPRGSLHCVGRAFKSRVATYRCALSQYVGRLYFTGKGRKPRVSKRVAKTRAFSPSDPSICIMGGSYLDVGGVRRGEESSVSILDDTRKNEFDVLRASLFLSDFIDLSQPDDDTVRLPRSSRSSPL